MAFFQNLVWCIPLQEMSIIARLVSLAMLFRIFQTTFPYTWAFNQVELKK